MLRDVLEVVLALFSGRFRVSIGVPAVFRLADQATVVILRTLIAPEGTVSGGKAATDLANVAAVKAYLEVRLFAGVCELV